MTQDHYAELEKALIHCICTTEWYLCGIIGLHFSWKGKEAKMIEDVIHYYLRPLSDCFTPCWYYDSLNLSSRPMAHGKSPSIWFQVVFISQVKARVCCNNNPQVSVLHRKKFILDNSQFMFISKLASALLHISVILVSCRRNSIYVGYCLYHNTGERGRGSHSFCSEVTHFCSYFTGTIT